MRRCGVPDLWPSRIKVLVSTLIVCGFMTVVMNYMLNADVSYLDLERPSHEHVFCEEVQPECHNSTDPIGCNFLFGGYHEFLSMFDLHMRNTTESACGLYSAGTCEKAAIPIQAFSHGLHTENGTFNVFRFAAGLFSLQTAILILSVFYHDITLLERDRRKIVYSWRAAEVMKPRRSRLAWGIILWSPMCKLRARNAGLWVLVPPVWLLYAVPVFGVIVWSGVVLSFICHPVRMSRIMVFCTAVECTISSVLVIVVETLVVFGHWKSEYAVMWFTKPCVCSCAYPTSTQTSMSIISICVACAYHGVTLFMRTLKGLRRREWATLLTVLYTIPVAVFPVEWTQPNGQPIRFRKEGEPVQGEPAFDPFALMDEQPDSNKRTVNLKPVALNDEQDAFWDAHDHFPLVKLHNEENVEIGCCGFPEIPRLESFSDEDSEEDSNDSKRGQ